MTDAGDSTDPSSRGSTTSESASLDTLGTQRMPEDCISSTSGSINKPMHPDPGDSPALKETPLRFQNVLLSAWPNAVERVEKGRKLIETLRDVLKERAQIEEQYAARLKAVAAKLVVPPTEGLGVTEVVNGFKLEAQRRAEQARDLAQAILSDVVATTLETTIQNHFAVLLQIRKDASNITDFLDRASGRVREAELGLCRLGRSVFSLSLVAQKTAPDAFPKQRITMATEFLAKDQELRNAEKRYRKVLQQANEAKRLYLTQMRVILASLEDMDSKRIACFKDALRKYMVYEMSALRNCQYDLGRTIHTVESLADSIERQTYLENVAEHLPHARYQASPTSSLFPGSPFNPLAPPYNPKHWATLILHHKDQEPPSLSINHAPGELRELSHLVIPSIAAMETATAAARNLLRNTSLDRVMQTAAAHLSSSVGLPKYSTQPASSLPAGSLARSEEAGPEAAATDHASSPRGPELSFEDVCALLGDNRTTGPKSQILESPARGRCASQSPLPVTAADQECQRVVESIWNFTPDKSEALYPAVHQLNNNLSSSHYRNVLLMVLDHRLKEKRCELANMDALHILGLVTRSLLHCADQQDDIVTPRAIVLLSQKFYALGSVHEDPQASATTWVWPHLCHESKPNNAQDVPTLSVGHLSADTEKEPPSAESPQDTLKWFLHRLIYHYTIWNRVHFWENAFLLSLSERRQQRLVHDAVKAVADTLNKPCDLNGARVNTLVEPLPAYPENLFDTFAASMIAFGIHASQVKRLIEALCCQYEIDEEVTEALLAPLRTMPPTRHSDAPSTPPVPSRTVVTSEPVDPDKPV